MGPIHAVVHVITVSVIFIPDIDECANLPCKNGGTCTDQLNSYVCTCGTGYTGNDCETGKSYLLNIHLCIEQFIDSCHVSFSLIRVLYFSAILFRLSILPDPFQNIQHKTLPRYYFHL